MTVPLISTLATTPRLAEIFSDRSIVQAMLDVEAALARAQAEAGVIPAEAAAAITRAARADDIDVETLARDGRASASLAIPLVAALTARVRAVSEPASRFVHWGATSQDVIDTALVILIGRAVNAMTADHDRLTAALRSLSDRHAGDLMLGRTLLQPAPPITFGLKVAGWFASERRSWKRVAETAAAAAVVQLGGASGTLASLGENGLHVVEALARELKLAVPPASWHAHRGSLAALVAACGVYVGGLGKVARDVSLLMQSEVGEAFEPGGGSSTMPHKRNPAGCAVVLAAATRLPGLVSTMLTSLPHEHERAVGGWHAEWPTVPDAIQTTGSALDAAAAVVTGLEVDTTRMRANLDAVGDAVHTERLMLKAGASLGRDRARVLLRDALARVTPGRPLADVIAADAELGAVLHADDLRDDVSSYVGQAESLRRRLLEED